MWNQQWKYWRAVDVIKRMPQHYQRYLWELENKPPQPVHFIPETKLITRDPETGEIKRKENRPIPLIFPPQCNEGLWGGEGIVKGFTKTSTYGGRWPWFWVPNLRRSVIYSEILNKHLAVTVTMRALRLIDENYGLDFYILKTHPVDLRSQFAMNLKRKLLLTLIRKEMYPSDPKKRDEIYEKYKEFIIAEEEAEWTGLSLIEAVQKQLNIEEEANKPIPLKNIYREELINKLKEGRTEKLTESSANWFDRIKSMTIGKFS